MPNEIAQIHGAGGGESQIFLANQPAALTGKEIRLLLPAFVPALLLAVISAGMIRTNSFLALAGFLFGLLLVAVSSFGREFSLRTFPVLLAQPSERGRTWWTKVGVLAAAFGVLFGVWWTGSSLSGAHNVLVVDGLAAAAVFSGGLWTTLLTRQATAAFWFTILIPTALVVFIPSTVASEIVLGLYAVIGFLAAWRLFFRAEEVGWSGGSLSVTGWRSSARTQPGTRLLRPYAALLSKELQLQQVTILGMAVLFVLHLGSVYLRDAWDKSLDGTLRAMLQVFALAWVVVPVLIASASVAEERRLGTLAGNLCLPVTARAQYAIKFFVALLLGVVGSAVLGGMAEAAASSDEVAPQVFAIILVLLPFVSMVCFYASTLAGNLIQALVVAVVIVIIGALSLLIIPWVGPLLHLVIWPGLLVVTVGLGARNYRTVTEGWNLWKSNLRVFLLTFLLLGIVCAGAHNRAWELIVPREPPHGPAVLTAARCWAPNISVSPPVMAVQTSDDKLYCELLPDPGRFRNLDNPSVSGQLVVGSNWVDTAMTVGTLVAVRADGTLWSGTAGVEFPNGNGLRQVVAPQMFQGSSNWLAVANYSRDPGAVVLLKTNGTLWMWAPNGAGQWRYWSPQRVGTNSDWARILSNGGVTYAWRKSTNGWTAYWSSEPLRATRNPITTDDLFSRVPALDQFGDCKSVARFSSSQTAFVRPDGTLWTTLTHGEIATNGIMKLTANAALQIGNETNWTAVSGNTWTLVGLKADGSLWLWLTDPSQPSRQIATQLPRRLSSQHDWLCVTVNYSDIVALAADGTLWDWTDADGRDYSWSMLVPSRKPTLLRNILAEAQ